MPIHLFNKNMTQSHLHNEYIAILKNANRDEFDPFLVSVAITLWVQLAWKSKKRIENSSYPSVKWSLILVYLLRSFTISQIIFIVFSINSKQKWRTIHTTSNDTYSNDLGIRRDNTFFCKCVWWFLK